MATAESVKAKIQGLINTANETTGGADTDLSAAVNALIAGFGQGSDNLLDYATGITKLFYKQTFPDDVETLSISFGSKSTANIETAAMEYVLQADSAPKSVKIHCGGVYSGGISFASAFRGLTAGREQKTEKIDLTGWKSGLRPSSFANTFREHNAIREVLGEFDMTYCTNCSSAFNGCGNLETIRFTQGTIKVAISFFQSPNLTDETIQNIVDGLADLTSGTAQTLTLHATVGAKLTDAQKTAISAKNWTVTY